MGKRVSGSSRARVCVWGGGGGGGDLCTALVGQAAPSMLPVYIAVEFSVLMFKECLFYCIIY